MKRLAAIAALGALITGVAFAQVAEGISLGVWGRTGFTLMEAKSYKGGDPSDWDTDNNFATGLGQTWGGSFGRAGRLNFSGNAEFVGFDVWIQSDGGTPGFGDFARIWAKPFSFLRVDFGKYNVDDLRGKVGLDTDFHNFVLSSRDANATFTRFQSNPGAMISLTPVNGLFVGVNLPGLEGLGDGDEGFKDISTQLAGDAYQRIQIAAGYEIANVGHIRLGYFGASNWHNREKLLDPEAPGTPRLTNLDIANYKRIEAAFALTSIDGMTVDIGVKIPFAEKGEGYSNIYPDTKYNASAPVEVNAGFDMTSNDFGIQAMLATKFGGGEKERKDTNGMELNLHLAPSYNLGFATVGGALGLEMKGKDKRADTEIENNEFNVGFGGWIMKDFAGKGYIKAGLTYTIFTGGEAAMTETTGGTPGSVNGIFRIPVIIQIAL